MFIHNNGKGYALFRPHENTVLSGFRCEALCNGEWSLGVADYFPTYRECLMNAQKHGYLLNEKVEFGIDELQKIANPEDFSWVKVKRHIDDDTKSHQSRLYTLQDHHVKETTFLLNKCRELAEELLKWKTSTK